MGGQHLADKIREKLMTGALPRAEPIKTWAGYGSGRDCAACGAPILPAQVEHEIEMPDLVKWQLHWGCHGLWLAARIRAGWAEFPNR